MTGAGTSKEGTEPMRSTQSDKISSRRFSRWAVAACVAMLGACASNRGLPPAPTRIDAPVLQYRIGALDVLNVVVWRNPEVSGNVTVRSDGFISMPLIGDVKASDKTPAAVAEEVKVLLSKMVLDPVVSVVVTTSQAANAAQVTVVGEAIRPQSMQYRQSMTLLDVMLAAGGTTNVADGNNAILIRGSEGGKQYSIRLKDLLKGDVSANVPVVPGDIVTVPQSVF